MNPFEALLKKKSCLLVRMMNYKHKGLNNNADVTLKIIYQIDKLLNHKKNHLVICAAIKNKKTGKIAESAGMREKKKLI